MKRNNKVKKAVLLMSGVVIANSIGGSLYPIKVSATEKTAELIAADMNVKEIFNKEGYILAINNEGINLKDIVLNVKLSNSIIEEITGDNCIFEDVTGNVTVKDGKLYVSNSGVTNIKVSCDKGEGEILVLSKDKEDKEYVLYEENFDSLKNGEMPQEWTRLEGQSKDKVGVVEGEFVIDGSKSPDNPSRVMLPDYLNKFSNYKIEADVTFNSANEDTRWNSIMYRIQPNKNFYYQMAVRRNATASNGVEFAQRNASGWNVIETGSNTEKIDSNKMYKYEIKAYGSRVQESINGKVIIDTNSATEYTTGGIGLQANGSSMKVDNLRVTLQEGALEKLPYEKYVDVKEINEDISLAPTTGIEIKSKEDLNILNKEVLPANIVGRVDKKLNIINDSCDTICTIDEFMEKLDYKAIPVFDIRDTETADALAEYLKENEIEDVTVIAQEGDIIKRLKDNYSLARGVLKFPYEGPLTEKRMLEIVQEANMSKAKTVLLPGSRINNDVAEYMQKRLVAVWAMTDGTNISDSHKLITSGINGVITGNFDNTVEALNTYNKDTIIREPLIVGHRGVPSLAPENTLEGAKLAYELGADVVENDIYLTKDNEIVIMHDATLDRTTTGTGNIEDYTLEELKKFKANKQFTEKYPDAEIPTLREYFEEFKDTDLVHFVEIKSYKPEIVDALKELVDEMGVQDQIVVISFSDAQIARMNEIMPEVSVGFLNGINVTKGDVRDNVRKVLKSTQSLNATFNPSYTCVNKTILEELKHRGMSVWPWTYRNINDFTKDFKNGIYGLTTDYSQWSSDLITDIKIDKSDYYITKGESVEINPKGLTYTNKEVDIDYEIVPIENIDLVSIDGNKIKPLKSGKVSFMVKTKVTIDKDSYNVYSEPITITIY